MPLQDPLAKYETQLTGFRANFLGSGDTGGFGGGFGSGAPAPGPIDTGNNPGVTIPAIPGTSVTIGGSNPGIHVGTSAGPTQGVGGTLLGLDLKRIVILIIGLICIFGAVYLFKSTSFIVKNAIGAGKDAIKGAVVAA